MGLKDAVKMKKTKRIILLILSLLCLFTGAGIMLIYSMNDNAIYHIPHAEKGIMDFSECQNYNKKINIPIEGELELYMNRWIETDSDTGTMDSYIQTPSKWSSSLNNTITYPKKGYASYKVTLKNLKPGTKISVVCGSLTLSVNAYMNHNYAGYCGYPSKLKTDRVADLNQSETVYLEVPQDGTIELVLETGLSEYGGLLAMPYLKLEGHSHTYMSFINFLPALTLGLLVFSIGISLFISFSLKRKEGRYYPFITFLCITAHFIFSYDILLRTRGFNIYASDMIFQGLSFFTLCIFVGWEFYSLRKINGFQISKYYLIASYVAFVILSILYFVFLATAGILWIWIAFFVLNIPIIVQALYQFKHSTNNAFFIFVYFIMIGLSISEMLDYTDLVSLTTYGHTSVYMIILMILTLIFYAHRLLVLNQMEQKSKDMEIEALKLKQDLLLKQIKPHFIYNALSTIMMLYHQDIAEGDEGIVLFSKYLRTNVDALEQGLVPFSDEIDNVINYIELVNLSVEPKFNLELDLSFEDFMIPVLSLQPIIENAVKYSRVNEKENGYIKISSICKEDSVILSISNNGVPFEVTEIQEKSKGLKNVVARLESALGSTVTITSTEEKTEFRCTFLKK